MSKVLIVDDDEALLRALSINLRARKYDVHVASTGAAALAVAARHLPDLFVLDLGLSDMDGVEVIAGLRGWSQSPILVLSARDGQLSKVAALDAGADDYVIKPFGMDELLARIRAALRRRVGVDEASITTDAFTIDLAAKRVITEGGEVKLTATEWHLLEVLSRHANRTVEHRQLLEEVWGAGYATQTNYLRVYVAALRRKLEPDPRRPRYLITASGLGYRLDTEP